MYCTRADLIVRFGEAEILQLSDRTHSGAIDDAVVAQAIADAAAEIDGYLASRYELPLAAVPTVLVLYACDIARYRLFEDGAYEQVVERYNTALRYLRDVAAGRVQLLPTGPDDAPEHEVVMTSRPSVFGGGY